MHQSNNTATGFISGLVGGAVKYYYLTGTFFIKSPVIIIPAVDYSYLQDLAKSGLTALICGAAGVLGKVLLTKVSDWLVKKFSNKNESVITNIKVLDK